MTSSRINQAMQKASAHKKWDYITRGVETCHVTCYLAPWMFSGFWMLWFVWTQQHVGCPLSRRNMSLITLGSFINHWGLILLGLGPYFSLLGASLVIWQQLIRFLGVFWGSSALFCTLVMHIIGLLHSGKCWHCHTVKGQQMAQISCRSHQ